MARCTASGDVNCGKKLLSGIISPSVDTCNVLPLNLDRMKHPVGILPPMAPASLPFDTRKVSLGSTRAIDSTESRYNVTSIRIRSMYASYSASPHWLYAT